MELKTCDSEVATGAVCFPMTGDGRIKSRYVLGKFRYQKRARLVLYSRCTMGAPYGVRWVEKKIWETTF